MVFKTGPASAYSDSEYRSFRDFLEKNCGIVLGENKNYLIDSRLRRIIRDNGIPSLSDLVRKVDRPGKDPLKQKVIDAMTTNETLWFRDRHPFEFFGDTLLQELTESGQPVNIWCAASSSGQEPYTISICAEEFKKRNLSKPIKDVSVIATDICLEILDQAKLGVYEMLALNRGMSNDRLKRYFSENHQGQWKIKPEIQRRVEFKQLNLKKALLGWGVLMWFFAEMYLSIFHQNCKIRF